MINDKNVELSVTPKLLKISFILKISLIIAVILIPPVLLMEHNIKYELYFFSLIFTGLIVLFIFKKNFEYNLPFPSIKIIDYFLLGISLILLAFNIFPDVSIEIPFVLSIVISFFLLGWVFIRFLDIAKSRINLSLTVISFCLSVGLTSLLYFFTLITGTLSALPFVFVGIAFLPLIRDRFFKNKKNLQEKYDDSKHSVFDLLVILGVTSFFVFFLITFYPEVNDLPGPDGLIHFLLSNQQVLTPDIYGSTYPWFHHTWGSVIQMSSPSMSLFLTGISVLGVFLIFSFYIMSKEYLKKIDQRAHLLATIFFSVFTGLGWIYFIQNKVAAGLESIPLSLELSLLQEARNVSWWDIGTGQAMWLFASFRPITVSFILIFVILYLMKRYDLSKRNFMIIVSFLGLTLSQIHVPEFIFFIVFLVVLAIFLPKVKLRLKLTCISLFFSSIASLILTFFQLNFFGSEIPQSSVQNYLILLPIIALSAYLLTLFYKRPKFTIKFNTTIAISIVTFIFVILVIIWISNVDNWTISELRSIFAVPIEFYPMLLGVTGIFGLIGGIIVLKKYSENPISIFIIFMVVGFIFARLLTYLNANVIETSYFERRVIPIVFVSVAMLAPLLILKLVDSKRKITSLKKTKDLWKVAFLAAIVVCGVFSTFLTFEYQILFIEKNKLKPEEKALIESLQGIDPYSSLVTVTQRSLTVAEFGTFGQILDAQRFKLWDWSTPEMPLNAISSLDSPTIFSLSNVDKKIISSEYSDGYLGSHLVNIASPLSSPNKHTVYYLPKLAPPISHSPLLLVIPEKQNQSYHAYDILSLGHYNYSTALIHDIETIRHANVLIAPNEKIGIQLMDLKSKYDLNFSQIIILNLNGYGPLVKSSDSLTLSTNLDLNSPIEWDLEGLGNGTISIPILENYFNPTLNDGQLLSIIVNSGKYERWSMSKSYEVPLDFDKSDLIRFDWHGDDELNAHIIQFTTSRGNYFWYKFQNPCSCIKQIVIPTSMLDGKENIFGIDVKKVTKGNPTWDKISKIEIKTDLDNKNNKGKFYFNGLIIDEYSYSNYFEDDKNNRIQFPSKLAIKKNIVAENFTVLSTYEHNIPFVLQKKFKDFNVNYVNVYPILQKLDEGSEDARDFNVLYSNILEIVDEDMPRYIPTERHQFRFQPGGDFTFKNFRAIGDVMFASPSIISKIDSEISVNIDGEDFNYENISLVLPVSVDTSTSKAKEIFLENGTGFYARIMTNSSSVVFQGNPAIISFVSNDGEIEKIVGQLIQIDLPEAINLVRQPSIEVHGIVEFEELVPHGALEKKLRLNMKQIQFGLSPGNFIVDGFGNFTIKFSDKYSFANKVTFIGEKEYSEPVYSYDEFKNLVNFFRFSNS